MSYNHFEYSAEQPIHRSIEMPASPMPDSQQSFPPIPPTFPPPSFPGVDAFDRAAPQFHPAISTYVVNGYSSSSSDETIIDPLTEQAMSPPPKRHSRSAKPDKGIKCDHCGVDKTPLWRKVPDKENAYHCNACGLYYKSNGCFRALEGDGRVIRHTKKSRKSGDTQVNIPLRTGPVTANRNVTCLNCGTNNTVLWRKGPDGVSPLCNPCGLFYKLHGSHRSPEKRKEIHRRNRMGKKRYSITTVGSGSSEEWDDEVESPNATVEFTFRQEYIKKEPTQERPRDYPPPSSEWVAQSQYQYQWQGASVPRC